MTVSPLGSIPFDRVPDPPRREFRDLDALSVKPQSSPIDRRVGTAFWQLTFDHWAKVPKSLEPTIVAEIRKRKGLPPEPPSPEKFVVPQ